MPWQVVCLNCDQRFRITDDEVAAVRQGRARCPGCRQQLLGENLRERSDGEISASPVPNARPSKDRQAEAESASEPGEPKPSVKKRTTTFLLAEVPFGRRKIRLWVFFVFLTIAQILMFFFFVLINGSHLSPNSKLAFFSNFFTLISLWGFLGIVWDRKNVLSRLKNMRWPWLRGALLLGIVAHATYAGVFSALNIYVIGFILPSKDLSDFQARALVLNRCLWSPLPQFRPVIELSTATLRSSNAKILMEVPRRACPNYLGLRKLRRLSSAVAEILEEFNGHLLSLDGLTEVTPEVAESLARGKASLSLDGLSEITPQVAELLVRSDGDLSLNGLKVISPDVAGIFAKHAGGSLHLDGLTSLSPTVARALAEKKEGWVWLSVVEEVDKETANILKANKDRLRFSWKLQQKLK
jgi:hypothetical protein